MNNSYCGKTVGKRIRNAMEYEKLNQRELSEKAGISLSMLNRYINDAKVPSVKYASKIGKILGLSADYILYGTV